MQHWCESGRCTLKTCANEFAPTKNWFNVPGPMSKVGSNSPAFICVNLCESVVSIVLGVLDIVFPHVPSFPVVDDWFQVSSSRFKVE